jgi:hypothetical protein
MSDIAEDVKDCVEGYLSVQKGGVRIGIIAEGSPL